MLTFRRNPIFFDICGQTTLQPQQVPDRFAVVRPNSHQRGPHPEKCDGNTVACESGCQWVQVQVHLFRGDTAGHREEQRAEMPYVLCADVGGTNSRLQLHGTAPDAAPPADGWKHSDFAMVGEHIFPSADFTSLGGLVEAFLAKLKFTDVVDTACIAVCGPVEGEERMCGQFPRSPAVWAATRTTLPTLHPHPATAHPRASTLAPCSPRILLRPLFPLQTAPQSGVVQFAVLTFA